MRRVRRSFPLLLLACLCLLTLGARSAQAQVPGRNVNMVSGVTWPGGDPFLQRQNEPSIAVSTRNPLHLLAGANDYRSVDLAGLLNEGVTGDAWLGLFKSFDGGVTWRSTLLPGCPQPIAECMSSPLRGFEAGADPTVRAGTNGLFYYSGIAFDRGTRSRSAVFVARFIDDNNLEAGDPIRYVGTQIIQRGNPQVFVDKPWLAVDVPRPGASTCRISDRLDGSGGSDDESTANRGDGRPRRTPEQSFPGGNVYLAFSQISGTGINQRSRVMFSRSLDCGATWREPIGLTHPSLVSQGATISIDPRSGTVYVAWRQIAVPRDLSAGNSRRKARGRAAKAEQSSDPGLLVRDAILVAKSTDGGKKFGKPVVVAYIAPFEQGGTATSFRTTNFPSMAVDHSGRVYVAWSQRGIGPGGDARVVISSSAEGELWTAPLPVDNHINRGHQLMPSLAFGGGKLTVIFYDLREDHTFGMFAPDSSGTLFESRMPAGDLTPAPGQLEKVFTPFVQDAAPPGFSPLQRRHTMDLWAAQAQPGPVPQFLPKRVSHYMFGSRPGSHVIEQLQFAPPNLPLFKQGTTPFMGDYVDVAPAPAFLPRTDGDGWRYNLDSAAPVFHAVWTDNRDVRPPADGNWMNYTPPSFVNTTSIFDPTQPRPACQPGQAGMRNQNIYSAQLTTGLFVGTPGNSKPLGTTLLPNGTVGLIQRGFAVFAQNTTDQVRSFRFTIANQPPGGKASFLQFPVTGFPDPLVEVDATIPPQSTAARTVFVTSTDPRARITVNIEEISAPGVPAPIPGGLQDSVILNPDITNPSISNPSISNPSISNPSISNAEVYNPSISNPSISNPSISNPSISNPSISNPSISNIVVANPDITNPSISNADLLNPSISNPSISNPSISNTDLVNGAYTDATWTITNNGNTAAVYSVRVLLNRIAPTGFKFQAVLHRSYSTPVIQGCEVKLETQTVVVANVPNPGFIPGVTTVAGKQLGNNGLRAAASTGPMNPGTPGTPADALDPDPSNTTLTLAPGESAFLTLRVFDPDRNDAVTFDAATEVTAATIPQAVNTADALQGVTQPPVVLALTLTTFTLSDAVTGAGYSQVLQAVGGVVPHVWSIAAGALPPGLALNPATGEIFGTPTSAGIFAFTAHVQDSSNPAFFSSRPLVIRVSDPLAITTATLPGANQGAAYSATLATAGGFSPLTWSVVSGALPAGLSLHPATGEIFGVATSAGTFNFTAQAADSSAPQQLATRALSIIVSSTFTGTLSFVTQPLSTPAGQPITPAVQVQVLDSAAAVVPNVSVTLAIAANPGAGTLAGAVTQTTDGLGIATFPGLSINNAATGYSLTASLPAFPGPTATSSLFSVTGTTSSASQVSARRAHTATLLQDGRVLLAGGLDIIGAPALSTAEIYDPATNTSTATGSMSSPRVLHTATVLPNGKILITGGSVIAGGPALSTAELYDPATGLFTSTGSMVVDRAAHTASLLANGLVLVMGGYTAFPIPLSSAELYDPGTGTFAPAPGMNLARWNFSATLLGDGRVLVAGGRDAGGSLTNGLAELYDPVANTFSFTGAMLLIPFGHTATRLADGRVLIAGGAEGQSTVVQTAHAEIYDPSQGSFSALPNLTSARSATTATLLLDGRVWIAGGTSTASVPLDTTEFFDPLTGQFTAGPNLSISRFAHSATRLLNGSVFVAGGATTGNVSTASTELFHPPFQPPVVPIVITTPSPLPSVTAGAAYLQTLLATGGTPPYTWSVAAGSVLPSGLTLSPSGVLSGTPASPGTFVFTVSVTDSSPSNFTLRTYSLLVRAPLTISPGAAGLPSATQGSAYSATLTGSGGVPPYTWSIVSGALPQGLTLDANTGVLSGTPAVSGSISFTVQLTDADAPALTATQSYTLQIAAASTSVPLTAPASVVSQLTAKFSDAALSTGVPEVSGNGHFVFRSGSNGSAVFLRRNTDTAPARFRQSGDEAPGFPGSRIDVSVGTVRVNSMGNVLVGWDFSNGNPPMQEQAIYLYDGVSFQRVAYSEDPAPGGGGLPFGRGFVIIGLNDANDVAFTAPIRPSGLTTPLQTALFVAPAGGVPVRIAGLGDVLPGLTGPAQFLTAIGMNAVGEVLFTAQAGIGTPTPAPSSGLYVGSATTGIRVIATNLTGSSFVTVPTSLNDLGQVAYGSGTLFVHTPGVGASAIVTAGSAAPAALGGTLSTPTLLVFNNAGQVAFSSNVTGSAVTPRGLFRFTPGNPIETVAYTNMPAPATTQNFSVSSTVSMNQAGQINFFSTLNPGATRAGIFGQVPGGPVTAIALEGQPAPLPGGGQFSFVSFATFRTLADGSVFLNSLVANGAAYAACWRLSPAGDTVLVSTEDPLPAGSRVVHRTFGIRTAGQYYAYTAELAGGPVSLWLHDIANDTDTRIIGVGDASPLPAAGRVIGLGTSSPAVNAAGTVAFDVPILETASLVRTALFVKDIAGTVTKIVANGDVDPATGRTFAGVLFDESFSHKPLNDAGQVAFRATLQGGNPFSLSGVFIGSAGNPPVKVVLGGDPIPGGGGNFANTPVFQASSLNNTGQVVFSVGITGGVGVFVGGPGGLQRVFATGDPDLLNGTFTNSSTSVHALNDAGELAFIGLSTVQSAVYTWSPLVGLQVIAALGQPAPSGGNFGQPQFWNVLMNNAGDVVFLAPLTGGASDSAYFLYRRATGQIETVVKQGDAAPGSGGGVFPTLTSGLNQRVGEVFDLDENGEVMFANAVLVGSRTTFAGYRYKNDRTLEKLSLRGDPVPGTGGQLAVGFLQFNRLNTRGRLTYSAKIIGSPTVVDAIIITNRAPVAIASAPVAATPSVPVNLDGSLSFDPDDDALTAFEWRDASNTVVGSTSQVSLNLLLGTHTFNLHVTDKFGATGVATVTVHVTNALAIATAALPPAVLGASYTHTLANVGAIGAAQWAITTGALPAGLALNSATGAITGIPIALGNFAFTVQLTDTGAPSASDSRAFTLTVAIGTPNPGGPNITTTSLEPAGTWWDYSTGISVTGGVAPYTWSLVSGALPPGINLVSAGINSGCLCGRPTVPGTYNFNVLVTDSANPTGADARVFQLIVLPGSVVTFATQPSATHSGQIISPPVQVRVTDLAGNPLNGVSVDVSMSGSFSAPWQAPSSMTGTTTRTTNAQGIATFDDLTVTGAGPYQLYATVAGTTPGNSDSAQFPIIGFAPAGAMTTSRFGHTATRLLDGRVLLVGGTLGSTGVTASAEIYDPATGTFAPTGSMSVPRQVHTASLLQDGRVLVAGGCDCTDTLATAEIYDPTTGSFTLTGSMSVDRYFHTAVTLSDGRVLIAGGSEFRFAQDYSTAEIFDPATGLFTLTGSMSRTYSEHSMERLSDGRVLISGGWLGFVGLEATAEIYNPATGAWTPTGNMSRPRADHAMVLLLDGTVLTLGGFTNNASLDPAIADIFDPVTGTFTALASPAPTVTFPQATLLGNGKVLVTPSQASLSTLVFDPVTQIFVPGANTLANRRSHSSTLLSSGKVLIAGGGGAAPDSAELYDPGDAPLSIITSYLVDRTLGDTHAETVWASGGMLPHAWSISSGALPTGLSLDPVTGVIDGVTTATGTFNFTVQVTDSSATPQIATRSFTVRINPSLVFQGETIAAIVGAPVNRTLFAGGVAPFTWTIVGGTPPAGVTFNAATAEFTGTPVNPGVYSVQVQVTDSSPTPQVSVGIVVFAIERPLVITTTALTNGNVPNTYFGQLSATGALVPHHWTLISGALPPGFTLSSTGAITGTATQTGTFNFTVQVTGGIQNQTQALSLVVNPQVVFITNTPPNGVTGAAYSHTFAATGGVPPYVWTQWSGTLPPGLGLNILTGELAGTPTTAGSFTFGVQVRDSAPFPRNIAQYTFTVVISTSVLTLDVNPPSLDFGDVAVGSNVNLFGTLSNSGNANLTITGSSVSGAGFSLLGLTLPLTLTPGQQAVFTLRFAPTAAGAVNGSATIISNATNSPTIITLAGNAVTQLSQLTANPSSVNFGTVSVGSSMPHVVILRNGSNVNVTITSTIVTGAGFSIPVIPVPHVLAPGQTISFSARFTPVAVGPANGNISVISDAPNSPLNIPLTGTGANLGTMVFIAPPASVTAGQTMPAVQVQLFDAANQPLSGKTVSLGFRTNPTGATLGGTLSQTTNASGLATFSNLTLNRGGGSTFPFAFTATSGLVNADSTPFNVTGFSPTASMSTTREQHTATLLPNGKVLVAGGINASNTALTSAEIYDPRTGVFTATGSLNFARRDHRATLLPDGRVLITGGENIVNGSVVAPYVLNAEIYDPVTGVFSASGSLNTDRTQHTATLLADGRVLIAGGFSYGNATVAEMFNPATGTFTVVGSLGNARGLAEAVRLPDGRVLIAGGVDGALPLSSAEIFDPATGTFGPTASMSTPRFYFEATLLRTGKVLMTGGATAGGGCCYAASAELFDPATGTFTLTGSMQFARSDHMAVLLPSGKVMVGGWIFSDVTEIYDPVSGTFSLGPTMPSVRVGHTGTLLPNGAVLVVGGHPTGAPTLATAELFHSANPPFIASVLTSAPSMNSARKQNIVVRLPDGKVLVAGGLASNTADLFDPVTNTMTATGNLSSPRFDFTGTLLPNGKVFVAGGSSSTSPGFNGLLTTEVFDPATGTFSPAASMASARIGHAATRLKNGKVLITGGLGTPVALATAELYDPLTNSFAATGTMSTARIYHTSTLLPDGRVLVSGGGTNTAELYDPNTGAFTLTGFMSMARDRSTATLLPSGKVLITGGNATGNPAVAELFDPLLGTFSTTGSMSTGRSSPSATLLSNGSVLVAGGFVPGTGASSTAEIYDSTLGSFGPVLWLNSARTAHTAALLADGRVFIAGGSSAAFGDLNTTETFRQGHISSLPSMGCSLEAPLQSLNSNTPSQVRFVNTSNATRKVYWLDFSGNRQLFATLTAGQSYVQSTFVTHPWVVTDASDVCQAIYLPVLELAPVIIP